MEAEERTLFIPFGTRLEFHLEAPAHAELTTRNTKNRASVVGRLRVTWQPDGGRKRMLTADLSAEARRRVLIGNVRAESGQLSLVALSEDEGRGGSAGMVMYEPRIRAASTLGAEYSRASTAVKRVRARGDAVNIIVYLIDALRADHIGCYGYQRDTTPNIDRFAAEAVLFENARAQSSWTRPAIASLFTGLWPQQHHINKKRDVLPEQAVTLAEFLRGAGYTTAAVIGNGNVASSWGFAQGFDYFKHLAHVGVGVDVARSSDIHRAIEVWLDDHAHRQPFFLYIHTVDPHLPYDPPKRFRSRFAAAVNDPTLGSVESIEYLADHRDTVSHKVVSDLLALYDAEIAANDASFGALLDELKQRGLYDHTLIALLSDHGEEFFDHRGWTHGKTLYAEMLNVPLIVKAPGSKQATRVSQLVDHVDIFASILDFVGLEPPHPSRGRSLRPLWEQVSEVEWEERSLGYQGLQEWSGVSYINPDWKLIIRRDSSSEILSELYDRRLDPRETQNLAETHPELVEQVRSEVERLEAEAPEGLTEFEIDQNDAQDVETHLRALGYL